MASPAKESSNDSHIIIGERRSLPQVYIGMGDDTGGGHIRHRRDGKGIFMEIS